MRTSPTSSEQFYGLRSRAFSLTPDLRFAYQSHSHARALDQVTAALRNREGLIVVTGEVGTGKTMLCRTLLETFETRMFQSVILDPLLTVEDLLYQVLGDFGLINGSRTRGAEPFTEVTRHALVTTLQKFLSSLIPLDAYAVIMIDEAQHLGPQVLEEIRLLSNFETDQAKLLQIVLVGQPNLDGLLRRPDMRQLTQRIARRLELQPLSTSEVGDYIERRLLVASQAVLDGDVKDDPKEDQPFELISPVLTFSPEAVEAVAGISGGVPRLVNTLCDRAIDAAYERRANPIDVDAVLAGAEHLKLPVPVFESATKTTGLWKLYAVAAVLAVAAIGVAWWYRRPIPAGPPTAAAPPPVSAPASTPPPVAAAAPVETTTPPVASAPPPEAAARTAPPPAPVTPPPSTAPTPAPVASPSPASAAPASPAAVPADGFQIFVASFRTQQRAEEVADEVRVGAGLPVVTRLDSTGRWYSIIAGPYKTTEEARTAQSRLERLGYPETRITPTGPTLR